MPQSLHLMKLKTMSDENLHATNHLLATRERALLKEIIDHLRETERRRLFAGPVLSDPQPVDPVTRERQSQQNRIRLFATFVTESPEKSDPVVNISKGKLCVSSDAYFCTHVAGSHSESCASSEI